MILKCIKSFEAGVGEEIQKGNYYNCIEITEDISNNDFLKDNREFLYIVYNNDIHIGYYSKKFFESVGQRRDRIISYIQQNQK